MIDFELTPEQREFRDMAHRFAEKTIRPAAAEADEKEECRGTSWRRRRGRADRVHLPEEYGGGGVESLATGHRGRGDLLGLRRDWVDHRRGRAGGHAHPARRD